jgi:chaperonin GroES
MKIRPLGDRILVRREKEDDKSPGGIIIPDNAKEKPSRGVVVAVGPGKVLDNGRLLEPRVRSGDHVVFGKYSGMEHEVDGDKLVVLREDDLLGVVEK